MNVTVRGQCRTMGRYSDRRQLIRPKQDYNSMMPPFNPITAACVRSLALSLKRMDLTRL